MSNPSNFIHLRSHSAYSLLEGAIKLPQLLKLVEKNNMPAVGLTDTGNLFGALEFSEKAKGMGIQPVSYTHLRAPRDLSTSRMPSSA